MADLKFGHYTGWKKPGVRLGKKKGAAIGRSALELF